jgi:putative SOS response-associated peptidase YedK
MCGRFPQSKSIDRYMKRIGRERYKQVESILPPTWNLAPSRPAWVIRGVEGELEPSALAWGFKDGTAAPALAPINARVETAATKFLFRDAWKKRRCLVPADGWYEWRMEHGRKQPYFFRRRDDEPLFFAGLWTGDTFCLLTTAADGELAQIHNRRPLALPADAAKPWTEITPAAFEQIVIGVVPAAEIAFHPVSPRVSTPRNDGPELIVEENNTPMPQTGELFPNSA